MKFYNYKIKPSFAALLLSLAMLFSFPALAGDVPTLGDALRLVQQTYQGKVLSASEKEHSYRIKFLTAKGEVVILRVDKNTGSISRE